MKKFLTTTLSIFLLVISVACSMNENANENIQVSNIWSRPALEGNNSAVYFTIVNGQKENDKLILAETTIAELTEIHLSSNVDGVMKMVQQEFVEIGAGDEVEFKPMDYHIMLINLNRNLSVGDTFEIILTFEKAGTKTFLVKVQDQE